MRPVAAGDRRRAAPDPPVAGADLSGAHGSAAWDALAAARDAGVDLDRITAELEREGVRSFCDSYHQLIGCLQSKLRQVADDDLDAERWLDEGGSRGSDTTKWSEAH